MDDLRVVSATVHNDTNEVEIVVMHEGDGFFGENDSMFILWISAEDVQEKGQKWEKYLKS